MSKSPPKHWCLLTGEYPPDVGGVSDYSGIIAAGLVARGVDLHIWASGSESDPLASPPDYTVHRLPNGFNPGGLRQIGASLNTDSAARLILLQYTPHAFGYKAMNLWLCFWLLWRRLRWGNEIRVMFHEVAYPFMWYPLHHNLIAAANRVMACLLILAGRQLYVSTPAWTSLLQRLGARTSSITWTPVPSNIPSAPDGAVTYVRRQVTGNRDGAIVVGHFGTCSPAIERLLRPVLSRLRKADPRVHALLIGRGGDELRERLVSHDAWPGNQVTATGGLNPEAAALFIQTCDLALQPYPDGVSTRRGSAMAWLANGVPLVTNGGPLSESIWSEDGGVELAATPNVDCLSASMVKLIRDVSHRSKLGERGHALYERRFAPRHTIEALLNATA